MRKAGLPDFRGRIGQASLAMAAYDVMAAYDRLQNPVEHPIGDLTEFYSLTGSVLIDCGNYISLLFLQSLSQKQ